MATITHSLQKNHREIRTSLSQVEDHLKKGIHGAARLELIQATRKLLRNCKAHKALLLECRDNVSRAHWIIDIVLRDALENACITERLATRIYTGAHHSVIRSADKLPPDVGPKLTALCRSAQPVVRRDHSTMFKILDLWFLLPDRVTEENSSTTESNTELECRHLTTHPVN